MIHSRRFRNPNSVLSARYTEAVNQVIKTKKRKKYCMVISGAVQYWLKDMNANNPEQKPRA